MKMSDVDFSFEAASEHRAAVARFAEDGRRRRVQIGDPNAPSRRPWPIEETGDGQPQPLFEVTKNKRDEVVSVQQLRPAPKSDEAKNRAKFECITIGPASLGGPEFLRVPAGVLVSCGEVLAFGLLASGQGKILREVRL